MKFGLSEIIYIFVKTFKVIHKNMKKTTGNFKKYGKPYERRQLLRRGDLKLIMRATGLAYVSVVQQIDGTRAITPAVKAMADKLADTNEGLINAINNINLEK